MGELTATKRAFNPKLDISEADVDIVPSFWYAECIIIREGPSKADRSGSKRRQNPRMLAMTHDNVCPAQLIRSLLIRCHGLTRTSHPTLTFSLSRPLFHDQHKQLTQQAVMVFIRRTLHAAGLPYDDYGTHSFPIGVFNRLFHMGAPLELI